MFKTIIKLASAAVMALSFSTAAMDMPHQGEVLETMNSGGYTYVKIMEAGKEVWAAAPQTKVEKGDTVRFTEQMTMPSFHSKTLDRTFAPLIFAGNLTIRK